MFIERHKLDLTVHFNIFGSDVAQRGWKMLQLNAWSTQWKIYTFSDLDMDTDKHLQF